VRLSSSFEFPRQQARTLAKARRRESYTLAYLASVILVMYLTMGSSQAMKTAWVEDVLSMVPPIVFLIAQRVAMRKPTTRFPFGYHRAMAIAFLCAALALTAVGGWLLVDATVKLLKAEHATIGGLTLFGTTFWQGWLMLPALAWSAVPAFFFGRSKIPLARDLHDKVLYTDAQMNKADWMTASAAMAGVVGVGMGVWWADAGAAALISLSVLHDGVGNLRQVVYDLMDGAPKTVDRSEDHPLPKQVETLLRSVPWIEAAEVRMREEGHVFFGEAFVVPSDVQNLPAKLSQVTRECLTLDWRLHDLVVVAVPSLDDEHQQIERQ